MMTWRAQAARPSAAAAGEPAGYTSSPSSDETFDGYLSRASQTDDSSAGSSMSPVGGWVIVVVGRGLHSSTLQLNLRRV